MHYKSLSLAIDKANEIGKDITVVRYPRGRKFWLCLTSAPHCWDYDGAQHLYQTIL